MRRGRYYLKKKSPKHFNKPKYVDGIRFGSQKEANYYINLKLLRKAGELDVIILQPRFELGAGATYTADFLNFWNDGRVTIEDVKSPHGAKMEKFILKKKLIEELYGIIIDVIL